MGKHRTRTISWRGLVASVASLVLFSGLIATGSPANAASPCPAKNIVDFNACWDRADQNVTIKLTGNVFSGARLNVPNGSSRTINLNGLHLNADLGIGVALGQSLTINDTSGGRLTAKGYSTGSAGIGGGGQVGAGLSAGSVTINKGTITSTGGPGGAGIGGGGSESAVGGKAGLVSIRGGSVTAVGGGGTLGGAGIGGGKSHTGFPGGAAGTVNVSGGTVTARGGSNGNNGGFGGAGIGGGTGATGGSGGNVSVFGGTVSAVGGNTVTNAAYKGPGIGSGIGGFPGVPGTLKALGLKRPGSKTTGGAGGAGARVPNIAFANSGTKVAAVTAVSGTPAGVGSVKINVAPRTKQTATGVPKKLKNRGTRWLNRSNARTNRGVAQKTSVKVRAKSKKRCYRVVRGKRGRIGVKATGRCSLRVTVTYTASATPQYLSLKRTKKYKTKRVR